MGISRCCIAAAQGGSWRERRRTSRPAFPRARAQLALRRRWHWIEYLRTVKPFGTNQRLNAESLTIAASLDLLIRGEFLRAGDVLAQRYKALELSAEAGAGWQVGAHLELAQERKSMISETDRRVATSQAAREARLSSALNKGNRRA